MTTIIRTARLEMRPLQTGDVDRVFALFSDPDVLRWMTAPPSPYTYADAHGFVAEKAAVAHDLRQTAYAITHDGNLIGAIDVHEAAGERRLLAGLILPLTPRISHHGRVSSRPLERRARAPQHPLDRREPQQTRRGRQFQKLRRRPAHIAGEHGVVGGAQQPQ